VGAAPASAGGAMVEAVPPEGIRPAQAGLLVDEVVNPVAIPATLVDLAVRGYLRIEDDAPDDWEKFDWRLVKLKAADKNLLDYERVLFDGLFASRGGRRAKVEEAVRLSELKQDFYHQSRLVRSALYQDAVQRGWFTDSPDEVQRRWVKRGRVVTVVGAALTLGAALTDYGLVALPILLAGPALMLGAKRMPRRTPVGAELLRRVNGFRAYLQTAGAGRADALHADRFSPDLPYAIVFGLTEQWARTVELVGAPPQTPWFSSRGPYTPHRFGARMGLFSSSSAASLTAPPPPRAVSGSSGFGSGDAGSWGGGSWGGGGSSAGGGSSGGGGGGGGGGSW
jgi:Predicted membrane protein (DUF2207)